MSEIAIEEKRKYMREYMKEYRKNNKEKIKEIQARYWESKALGKEEEFKKELKGDSITMNELRAEKLSEKLETLKNEETLVFYVEDLETEILNEIENNN